MELFAGIDIGSVSTKVVLLDGNGEIKSRAIEPSGIDFSLAASTSLNKALKDIQADSGRIVRSVSTGYGRDLCPSDLRVTEITCHAKAGYAFARRACTVLDIGGQDTKVVSVDDNGSVGEFQMNRKCAAGTGAFLEEMARKLGLSLDEINGYAGEAEKTAVLSSFCTVFAMTEVLKRIHEGATVQELARGVYQSMVSRTVEMEELEGLVVATGGVVEHHPVFIEMLGDSVQATIEVVPKAQFAGAWGAAIVAVENR